MSLVLNVEILGEFKKLTQATTGAQKSLQGLQKGVGKISSSINGTLAAIGVGFSLNAVVNGIKGAVEAASELEQQTGALDSVFKDLSPSMQEFAKSLSPIGLSSADASRSMALLGAQLKGYGLPVDEAAGKTKELTLLAADLAATFGGTTADAVSSISALFRGEYDPIEKYGVAIKKSDVNARLAAEGLAGLEGEALKQAEAQAALAILFEKTADAQGQAARESDTYASQTAFLRAEFENTKAELGNALIPVFIQLAEEVRNNIPQIRELVAGFVEFVKWIGEATLYVIKNKDAILPLVATMGSLLLAYKAVTLGIGAYNAIAGAATTATNLMSTAMGKALGAIGLVIAALETVQWLNSQIMANGGWSRANENPAIDFSGQTGLKSPNTGSFTNMAPSVTTKTTTVPKATVTKEKAGGVVINNNVSVKSSTATADDIVNAINSKIKATGNKLLIQ